MRGRRRLTHTTAFVTMALALLVLAGPGAAQELAGTAVDAEGRPLPDIPIALHRVGGGSGNTVATGATDADGRFSFPVEGADSAVYFVAIRHGDNMYIGPPARPGTESVSDYVVRAEEASEVGAITAALSGAGARPLPAGSGAARDDGGAVAIGLVTVLAVAMAAVFLATAPAYRRRQRRGLLIELARIENRLAGGDAGTDPAADLSRRQSLRERLAPRT